MKIEKFIAQFKITMTSKSIDSRPDRNNFGKYHYAICLHRGKAKMNLYYSMGAALVDPPALKDVLECLASDASCIDNAKYFENWADDLGLDPDSREAKKIYNATLKNCEGLKALLGNSGYDALLYKVKEDE